MRLVLVHLFLAMPFASADPPRSTSAHYSVLPSQPGTGGGQVTGTNISAQISVGHTISGGVSNITATGTVEKAGFTGQLYDPKTLAISATPTSFDEGDSVQLRASAVLDDDTTLESVDPTWTMVGGAIGEINATGFTTLFVYRNDTFTLEGRWLGLDAQLSLTIRNLGQDDFGLYASDGIDDLWQVGFFGEHNLDGIASMDPDGDDQNNLFEFLALVDPLDPASFFDTKLRPGANAIVFSPVFPADRNYTVLSNLGLSPPTVFTPLTGGTISDNGSERTVTDPAAASAVRKFYKIQISRP